MNDTSYISVLDKLIHKYENLQELYYSMYVESFSVTSFFYEASNFIKLYNDFKCVCRLLTTVKNLIEKNYSVCMLGLYDIKFLSRYKDIKHFMDANDLYSIIDSNHIYS
jgi:hypothetical protein